MPKITVGLRITSTELDCDQLTSRIAVAPTRCANVGDELLGGRRVAACADWCFMLEPIEGPAVEAAMEPLIGGLQGRTAAVRLLAEAGAEPHIVCWVRADEGESVDLTLSREVIRWLESLGADLDLDINPRADAN